MAITLAFYKAPGGLFDLGVRMVTNSKYSHVEIIKETITEYGKKYIGYTSSARDGGVVIREIPLNPNHWDLLEIDFINPNVVYNFIEQHQGEEYDWTSIWFLHLIHLGIREEGKWTCSALIANALGLSNPWYYNPGSLYETLLEYNFSMGLYS